MTAPDPAASPEFSRKVGIDEIRARGRIERRISANEAECALLAARFGLTALETLEADVVLHAAGNADIVLTGRLEAKVEQSCSVTLKPLKSAIASRFSVRYTSPQSIAAPDGQEDLDPLGDDIEPLPDLTIDVGEVTAQYLALEIDPYPRAPGAAAPTQMEDRPVEDGGQKRPNPFAVLKKLQDRG